MRKLKKIVLSVLVIIIVLCGVGCNSRKEEKVTGKEEMDSQLDPKNPLEITVWHYYNGSQLAAFDEMVTEFNDTIGKEKGIIVTSAGQGTVGDLQQNVLDAANKKVGAPGIPDIFSAYADTAYAVDKLGLVANINDYMTEKELGYYIEGYIEEGKFDSSENYKIFPIAKSTEIFMINKTEWDKFENATGVTDKEFQTIEGITKVAKTYYEWSGGKAFFGRDAIANYMIIGAKQLGMEIFTVNNGVAQVNFEKEVVRKLWDNYYVPYISGYFVANGRFRTDDIKTGDIIALVGATTGAVFFPNEVIISDDESKPIEVAVYETPQFEGSEKYAVQ